MDTVSLRRCLLQAVKRKKDGTPIYPKYVYFNGEYLCMAKPHESLGHGYRKVLVQHILDMQPV